MHSISKLTPVVLACLLIAACGSGSSPKPAATSHTTAASTPTAVTSTAAPTTPTHPAETTTHRARTPTHPVPTPVPGSAIPRHLTPFEASYAQALQRIRRIEAHIATAAVQGGQVPVKRPGTHPGQRPISLSSRVASEISTYAAGLAKPIGELKRLTPPARVAADYRSLLTALAAMRQALAKFHQAAASKSTAQAQQARSSYIASIEKMGKASISIVRGLGIKIPFQPPSKTR
jgi:hypothetical protein